MKHIARSRQHKTRLPPLRSPASRHRCSGVYCQATVGGIASIEEVRRERGEWVTTRRLNGDQSNQGRELMMDGRGFRVYRVKLYAISRPENPQ